MKKNTMVSVSSLPAENNLFDYVKQIESYADFLHCDFMDGTITTQTTKLNTNLVEQINQNSTLPLDVHIMSNTPKNYIEDFKNAGANIITIHAEVFKNKSQLIKCLKNIKDRKTLCGIAINVKTDTNKILDILPYVDLVLLMSVELGNYGQKFEDSVFLKLQKLNSYRNKNNLKFLISVDGGINNNNCDKLKQNGADILVSGGYIFNDTNYQYAINSLKK